MGKAMPKMQRSPDILELEKMLDDGEGDDVLVAQAIKIYERLDTLRKTGRYFGTVVTTDLEQEDADFLSVIMQIRSRRHAGVLDGFERYLGDRAFDALKKAFAQSVPTRSAP